MQQDGTKEDEIMGKVFGYPEFDENGEQILTTYENEYKDMMSAKIILKQVRKIAKLSKKWLEKLQKLCKMRLEKLQNKQKSGWKK